jgi:hypothetical protein
MNPILSETIERIKKYIKLTPTEASCVAVEIGNAMSKVAYGCKTNQQFNLCGGSYADENSNVVMPTEPLTNDDLVKIGFIKIPHFTVHNGLTYHLDRKRILSAGAIGTPNEMIFLCQLSDTSDQQISDLICIHNYDYDGYLTMQRLMSIIELFGRTNKTDKA